MQRVQLGSETGAHSSHGGVPPLGEILDFLRVLWGLDHSLQRMSKYMESHLGITGPQRLVVRLVGRFPGISAGELATIMRIHPSTLTGILQRLQRQGLISRRSDVHDGRRVLFGLTQKGHEIEAHHEGTVEAAVRELLQQVPTGKLRDTSEVLARLTTLLDGRPQSPNHPAEPSELRQRGYELTPLDSQ